MENCQKILKVKGQESNLKALFNLGRAYVQLKLPDEAKKYLTEAAKIAPKDVLIQKELAKIPGLMNAQRQKETSTTLTRHTQAHRYPNI